MQCILIVHESGAVSHQDHHNPFNCGTFSLSIHLQQQQEMSDNLMQSLIDSLDTYHDKLTIISSSILFIVILFFIAYLKFGGESTSKASAVIDAAVANNGTSQSAIQTNNESPASAKSNNKKASSGNGGNQEEEIVYRNIRILFGTFRGRGQSMAHTASRTINNTAGDVINNVQVYNLNNFFPEDLLTIDPAAMSNINSNDDGKKVKIENIIIFIISTYSGGACPPSCKPFFDWMDDCVKDFRVPRDYFSNIRFAVFGLGSSAYDPEYFCTPSRKLEHDMLTLGGRRLTSQGFSDEAIGGEEDCFNEWFDKVIKSIRDGIAETQESLNLYNDACCSSNDHTKNDEDKKGNKCCGGKDGACACNTKSNGDEKEATCTTSGENGEDGCGSIEDDENGDYQEDDDIEDEINAKVYEYGDMEDLALPSDYYLKKGKGASQSGVDDGPREMVTLTQRKQLTKEGYKLIGSHSAVKLCRWTKAQLRGRGGCYKHTFYNITSHNCMEATPSLACANKCTFCWRHNRHPVGKEWRWKMDPPEMIVEQAIEFHRRMVKELKGMPGLIMDRYKEAMDGPHHCALSLVGEPIMYPRINDMLAELHKRNISSFLVTNAQFPDAIEKLDPVTQLYVSVDAPSRDELKSVDRPLFSDFWERLHASLSALKRKKQRTVYRLTLIKGQNMGSSNLGSSDGSEAEEKPWTREALEGYVRLAKVGEPDFIEIKGVTYCGKGDETKPTLLMQNVPWHQEVRGFCEELCSLLDDTYGLACEHAHSLCVLLARKDKFYNPYGKWHTWIDYEKFFNLVASGSKDFTAQDYACETPSWALFKSKEEGFDPDDTRWRKIKAKKSIADESIDSSSLAAAT